MFLRRLVDVVCVVSIGAIAYGAVHLHKQGDKEAELIVQTRAALVKIQGEVVIRSQSGQATVNPRGWAATVEPAWFGGEVPINLLMDDDRPWMEIASVEQAEWEHPSPFFDTTGHDASFWYNPALGIVRARVPMLPTDARTLAAYNEINGVSLESLSPPNKTTRPTTDTPADGE